MHTAMAHAIPVSTHSPLKSAASLIVKAHGDRHGKKLENGPRPVMA